MNAVFRRLLQTIGRNKIKIMERKELSEFVNEIMTNKMYWELNNEEIVDKYLSLNSSSMNEYLKSQIDEHCQMVQRGAKPLSLLSHQERYYDEIIEIIKSYNLYYSSELNSDGWRTVYIYKNKTIRFLIPELAQKPESASEHALIGLLLGYNIDSVCDFILDKCKLDEPNIM